MAVPMNRTYPATGHYGDISDAMKHWYEAIPHDDPEMLHRFVDDVISALRHRVGITVIGQGVLDDWELWLRPTPPRVQGGRAIDDDED